MLYNHQRCELKCESRHDLKHNFNLLKKLKNFLLVFLLLGLFGCGTEMDSVVLGGDSSSPDTLDDGGNSSDNDSTDNGGDTSDGGNTGRLAFNFVWDYWESSWIKPKNGRCKSGYDLFDGHCFKIDGSIDAHVKKYSDQGIVITGVFYGTPEWARRNRTKHCRPINQNFAHFCLPDNYDDFARFAGYIAKRYNGKNGHGRVVDFVVMNEVNAHVWFDYGCSGRNCKLDKWTNAYASIFNKTYDAVIVQQGFAKVLLSFEHHFGDETTDFGRTNPTVGVKPFLKSLIPKLGKRQWRVAHHPYPPNLQKAEFSATDYPKVTFGNVGVLLGWLTKYYPEKPYTREIQLTENGVNSIGPNSTEEKQADGVCRSFQNILATPGIESYIYHRMLDHHTEVDGGLGLGLWNNANSPKKAWNVWKMANRNDLNPSALNCGFEDLPYTVLSRSYHSLRRYHWNSSRLPPSGYKVQKQWKLLREKAPDTHALYECVPKDNFKRSSYITKDFRCGENMPMGIVGYGYSKKLPQTVALYRCRTKSSRKKNFFLSQDVKCENEIFESRLAYVLPK